MPRFIEVSAVIEAGTLTYSGPPPVVIVDRDFRERYQGVIGEIFRSPRA